MENINIGVLDYCILAVYVCMMLGVGFYFKASAKMADYAVADKKLGLLSVADDLPGYYQERTVIYENQGLDP